MLRFDIGKLHLDVHDFAGTVAALDGATITPARNNRAVALFHLGRIGEALSAFMEAWEADLGNLFALSWALRLRLCRGDETGAKGLAVPLARAEARRIEDAWGQILGLLMVREDQVAWDAFQRSREADWSSQQVGPLNATRLHLGGCAASRLGLELEAAALWRAALGQQQGHSATKANLAELEEEGAPLAWPEFLDQGQTLPLGWLTRLREGSPDDLDARVDEFDASNAYLEALYLGGDAAVRGLATLLLKRRLKGVAAAEAGSDERGPAAILRDLLRLPIGTDAERFGLLSALREGGALAPGESVWVLREGVLGEFRSISTEVYRDPEPGDLPEDLQDLLERSILAQRDSRLDEAEAALDVILKRVPDYRIALGNLAAIRAAQGRGQEARDLLRRAVSAHPDYLMGRCNLAGLLIGDDALDEAQALLDGLAERPRMHIQDFFVLYGALAMLQSAKGEAEAADRLIASLEQIAEDEDDQHRLAQVRAQVARVAPAGSMVGLLRRMLETPPKPYKPKRR